jgi:hypothetical protein
VAQHGAVLRTYLVFSAVGRGSRPIRRWRKDRQRKKKERVKRQAEAAAPPAAPARRRSATKAKPATKSE